MKDYSDASIGTAFTATLTQMPRAVGGYRFGEPPGWVQFNLTRKPSWWHRFWMRVCLGWEWVDTP